VNVISMFSAPDAVAGATTTGTRSPPAVVMPIVTNARPERVFVAVKLTV
jgi:hypothetical protein